MKNFKKERAEARKKAKELVSKMTLMENTMHLLWKDWEYLHITIGMKPFMEWQGQE